MRRRSWCRGLAPVLVLLGCSDAHPTAPDAGSADASTHEPSDDGGLDASVADAGDGGRGLGSYPRLQGEAIGEPELLLSGFGLAESPLWDRCTNRLLLPDVVGGGRVGVIHSIDVENVTFPGTDEDAGASPVVDIELFASDTSNTNGIAYEPGGALIMAQMGGAPGHLARRDASGAIEILEPPGSPALHTPDDVVVRSDGAIYFSDGDFYPIGNLLGYAAELPVYLLRPGADALVEVTTVSGPNGVELSPDERTLYVSAYGAGTIMAFGVRADGSLEAGTPLLSGLSRPDSLCLDAAGNLYVGVAGGLQVARPDGEQVALIPIPGASGLTGGTTNCTFGGRDGRTLYVTSWNSLYRVESMPIPGLDWLVGRERQVCD